MTVRRPDYGLGIIDIDLESLEAEERGRRNRLTTLGLLIKEKLSAKDYTPPLLPEVAISLTELTGRRDVAIREVEITVSRDPNVAAKMVSMANSAFYSRGTPVKSLRDAIMRLGLVQVRDVAFQVVAKTTVFRVPGFSDRMRELFDAATAAGLFARRICQLLRFESEMAYLCGLLHDMGEAIILSIIGTNASEKGETASHTDAEVNTTVEKFHASAGALICSLWGLPDMVCRAVLHHHRPEEADDAAQMSKVVAVSDLMLEHIGLGVEQREIHPLDEPIFYALNLTPNNVNELLAYAESVSENKDALYL